MSQAHRPDPDEQARYWNEEGGERWVRYIDRLERMLAKLSARLIDAVDARPGEHVLDIGCGGGPTSAAYAAAVGERGRVLGVDVSRPILEVARRRFTTQANLEFIAADAAAHPFESGAFDVLTSRFGVMFFPEPESAFAHLRQAVRADGRLCFLCWRSLDDNPWMGAPARAAFEHVTPPEKLPPGSPGPFSLADPERLRALLTGAGFAEPQLEALDETIVLGDVDAALAWLTDMGPAARPLAEAEPAARERALAAMREVLEAHQTAVGVSFAGSAWLVRARASGA